jgi:hypothetical protein
MSRLRIYAWKWLFLYFYVIDIIVGSRYSAVCIATGYWLDVQGVGVRVPVGSRISSPYRPIQWVPAMGTWGSFPEGKAVGT